MKQLGAVVAAVLMILVALAIRERLDDNGSDGGDTASGPVRVVCITELTEACSSLKDVEVTIEDASLTAKKIVAGTADIDAWVTFDPWPAMTNVLANRDVADTAARVVRSDLVTAMVKDRAEQFAPTCGGTVNWRCLGDAIGKQWAEVGGDVAWGEVKAGIPRLTTASGTILLGGAAVDYFGRTDFATNDFDDAFRVWKAKVTKTAASFSTFLQQFPAAFSAVGAIDAQADPAARAAEVTKFGTSSRAAAVVVIGSVEGRKTGNVAKQLKPLLEARGWSSGGVSDPTGLPDPGVLLALSGLTA